MTKKDSRRIQGTEVKFLRRKHGKTKSDRIHNTKIREILKSDKIQYKIEDSTIRWYGHVKRMNPGRMPKHAQEYRLEGKRPRGWPR